MPDVACPPDYVAHALETMATTGAANVGAVQVPVGTAPMQISIARAMKHWLPALGQRRIDGGAEQSEVDTAFLGVYDVDVLRSLTGWDVTFARNEDAELNQRLRAAGHRVVLDPRLRVDYEPRDDASRARPPVLRLRLVASANDCQTSSVAGAPVSGSDHRVRAELQLCARCSGHAMVSCRTSRICDHARWFWPSCLVRNLHSVIGYGCLSPSQRCIAVGGTGVPG